MPHQYSPHHRRRSKRYQYELFSQPVQGVTASGLDWRMLPAETRQALTTLMARLILGYTDGACRTSGEETCHDD